MSSLESVMMIIIRQKVEVHLANQLKNLQKKAGNQKIIFLRQKDLYKLIPGGAQPIDFLITAIEACRSNETLCDTDFQIDKAALYEGYLHRTAYSTFVNESKARLVDMKKEAARRKAAAIKDSKLGAVTTSSFKGLSTEGKLKFLAKGMTVVSGEVTDKEGIQGDLTSLSSKINQELEQIGGANPPKDVDLGRKVEKWDNKEYLRPVVNEINRATGLEIDAILIIDEQRSSVIKIFLY